MQRVPATPDDPLVVCVAGVRRGPGDELLPRLAVAVGWAAGARAERSIAPLRAAVADAVHDLLANLDVLTAYGALDAATERVRRADAALRRAVVRRGGAQGLTSGAVSVLVLSGVSTRETLKTYAYRPSIVLDGVGDIPGPAEQ